MRNTPVIHIYSKIVLSFWVFYNIIFSYCKVMKIKFVWNTVFLIFRGLQVRWFFLLHKNTIKNFENNIMLSTYYRMFILLLNQNLKKKYYNNIIVSSIIVIRFNFENVFKIRDIIFICFSTFQIMYI